MKDSLFNSRPPVDSRAVGAVEATAISEETLAAESSLTSVVGLGGSAGNLDALQRFFKRTPVDTGLAFVVVVHFQMPDRLIEYHNLGKKLQRAGPDATALSPGKIPDEEREEHTLREILTFVKTVTGHDFSGYKRAIVRRRIGRWMQVNRVESLGGYVACLRTHSGECTALLQDLLISVTHFFRDQKAFAALAATLPGLFEGKRAGDSVRVWVPGCATGEEAFSIAMLLREYAATLDSPPQIQIFASDLDQAAITLAREGGYPTSIVGDVSEKRLQQFFTKEAGGYRVQRALRELILFAVHDVLKDSPFSRLDLVSCRNLLIYLNRSVQLEVFDVFHFALLPEGKLFLGSSETAEDVASLFTPFDKEFSIHSRQSIRRVGLALPGGAASLSFPAAGPQLAPVTLPRPALGAGDSSVLKSERGGRRDRGELHLKLIERISPPSLVVNRDHHIIHLSASTGKYLQFGGGEPSMELLRVVHPQLKAQLRAALFRAAKSKACVEIHDISWESEGSPRLVDLSVVPADDLGLDYILILFHERGASSVAAALATLPETLPDSQVVQHLEEELDQINAGWRETVEQYEASLQELSASNG